MLEPPHPPHDCRITLRCLKRTFGFTLPLDQDFASLRDDNTLIDRFFERRENDAAGGEGGQRASQIRSCAAFKLTSGRMRGATWFDTSRPPQGIVWLLGAEPHDERHKGKSDAYDVLGALDAAGQLFPEEIDYERLELDRRRWDTERFAADARRDAEAFAAAAIPSGITAELASVPARAVIIEDDSFLLVHVAISAAAVVGARSGVSFPLTQERFLLLGEAVRAAFEDAYSPPVLIEEVLDPAGFPGGLGNERALVLLIQR